APDEVVEAEGQPGERHVVADVKRGEHPVELGPAEAAVVGVVEEVLAVVPAPDEVVAKSLLERGEGGEDDHGRDQPERPGRRGSGAGERPARLAAGRRRLSGGRSLDSGWPRAGLLGG